MAAECLGIAIKTLNDHEWDVVLSAYTTYAGLSGLWSVDVIKTQLQVIGRILQENEPKTAIQAVKTC